jgi:alpha-glucosidase
VRNVEVEKKDPDSIYNFYKKLIALRRSNAALREGNYVTLNPDDPNVLSFLRKAPSGETVIVALNMSGSAQTLKFDLKPQGIAGNSAKPLLLAPQAGAKDMKLDNVTIPPFGVVVAEVK